MRSALVKVIPTLKRELDRVLDKSGQIVKINQVIALNKATAEEAAATSKAKGSATIADTVRNYNTSDSPTARSQRPG